MAHRLASKPHDGSAAGRAKPGNENIRTTVNCFTLDFCGGV